MKSGLTTVTIPAKGAGMLAIRRFLPAGGEVMRVTPTEARLGWTAAGLNVEFVCAEPDPRHQSLQGKLGEGLSNPVFADMVAVQVRPSWERTGWLQVAVALSGRVCAESFPVWPLPATAKAKPVRGCGARVSREVGRWRARVVVPWAALGGRPAGCFGLNLLRVRGQSAERLSPVALDFSGEPAPDLFMEAWLGRRDSSESLPGALVRLPSGAWRWQRPARLAWPTADERRELWRRQEGLAAPTVMETLDDRSHLAQRLQDVLILEGFSFHPEGGSWFMKPGDHRPEHARRLVNEALRAGDVEGACGVMDHFLGQLDRAVRFWFADGSAGNVRAGEWTPLDSVGDIACRGDRLVIQGRAGGRPVTLMLSSPWVGGFRLCTQARGFFRPPAGRRLECRRTKGGVEATAGDVVLSVWRSPWSITATDRARTRRWVLERGDLAFRFDARGRALAVDWRRPLTRGEGLYGFGERFDALDQRGRVVTLWDLDAWEGCFYTIRNHAYKPIPLYHSTAGHTCFVNSSYRLRVDVGQGTAGSCRFTQHGGVLDLCVWLAEPLRALDAYTAMTGRPVRPPRWAFEPWFGGGWGRWKHGPLKDPAAEMLGVARRFAALDIPHAAVYAEGEGSLDPRLFTGLAPLGIRPLTWMNSTLGLEAQRKLLPGVADRDLPILRTEGGATFPYIDFTHPRALDLVRAYWKRYLDLGIAGSMVDFGDLVPEGAVFSDGRRGDAMHNLYAYDYHRTFQRVFAERRGDDFVLFSRSAAPGSQRWLCQFAGDHPSNFAGLGAALRGGLNLGACGFSTWGCDIGGYHVWPDPEVYIRWVQWGAFSPIMRCHGTQPREPWEYGEDAVRVYRRHAWIRRSLQGYLESGAAEASASGRPLMCALPLAFPGQPHLAGCDDAYLLGRDLLVAPVHAPGDRRSVPMPAGRWTDLWTGRVYQGGRSAMVPAPLDRIPVFLRDGARVPARLNAALEWGGSLSGDSVGVLVVTPEDGAGLSLDLADQPDILYVLIYGAAIGGAAINGEKLPRLSGAERASCPPGWYRDGRRTVIRLPAGIRRTLVIGRTVPV